MLVKCPRCHKSRELKSKPSKDTLCVKCSNISAYDNHEYKNYIRVCKGCGDKKKVRSKKEMTDYCFKCQGILKQVSHFRLCLTCGDIKKVDRVKATKSNICSPCHMKVMRQHQKPAVINHYFCHTCPDVRVTKLKKKTNYCGDCSRKRSKSKSKGSYSLDNMKFIPIVTKKVIKPKKVLKMSSKSTVVKSKKKVISSEAIQKQRDINKQHREAVKDKDYDMKPNSDSEVDNQKMIKSWLNKNKPSVIDHPEIPFISQKSAYASGSSVMTF